MFRMLSAVLCCSMNVFANVAVCWAVLKYPFTCKNTTLLAYLLRHFVQPHTSLTNPISCLALSLFGHG